MMQYFETEKMTGNITRIADLTGVFSYLVTGTERAALIDTGTGFGDISALVHELTNLPVIVILTHGHCDHAGGAGPFPEVYLNEADWELVKESAALEFRARYVNSVTGGRYHVTGGDLVPDRAEGYLPLEDGQTFDLGSLTLEAIRVKGHTPGMTCILIREERRIIFGDACNTATFLWLPESSGIDTYKEKLLRLKQREKEYDSVYLCHEIPEVGKQILDEVLLLCDEILAGTDDAAEFPLIPIPEVIAARTLGKDGMPLAGGMGNIIYHKNRIRG